MQSQVVWYCHRVGLIGCRETLTLEAQNFVRSLACIERFENTRKEGLLYNLILQNSV
jgi:hypothetical protein